MRVTATVASLSWIPSESIWSPLRLGIELGLAHWDDPLPYQLDLPAEVFRLQEQDRFRFANLLSVWAERQDDQIVDAGFSSISGLVLGATTVRVGRLGATFRAVSLPSLRQGPQKMEGGVRFVQTVGGRTGVPLPRRVSRKPFVQWSAPIVWTTLDLTVWADGRTEVQLLGASAFPRHWVYDPQGRLALKTGLTDEYRWLDESFAPQTPWGAGDSPALVSAVESSLEQQLSTQIMRGTSRPEIRRLPAGAELARQGEPGRELFLVLDGVIAVQVDGEQVAEVGPGAVIGERALLEGASYVDAVSCDADSPSRRVGRRH